MVGSNHGGGCACARSLPSLPTISHTLCVLSDLYSLCPSGEPLTERCFQQTPLPFVGSQHTIRYGPLKYRTAARTLFLRPYLAHFCSFFRGSFAALSVLAPGFQKVAPKDRGTVP